MTRFVERLLLLQYKAAMEKKWPSTLSESRAWDRVEVELQWKYLKVKTKFGPERTVRRPRSPSNPPNLGDLKTVLFQLAIREPLPLISIAYGAAWLCGSYDWNSQNTFVLWDVHWICPLHVFVTHTNVNHFVGWYAKDQATDEYGIHQNLIQNGLREAHFQSPLHVQGGY